MTSRWTKRAPGAALALALGVAAPAALAQEAGEAQPPRQAVFRALDKVTARVAVVEAPLAEPAHFGSLELTVRTCSKRPPEEPPEVTAFVEIRDRRVGRPEPSGEVPADAILPGPPPGATIAEPEEPAAGAAAADDAEDQPVFSGWMFASSPGLSALEHPVYDIWLIDCRTI